MMMVSPEWIDRYYLRHVENHLKGFEGRVDPILSSRIRHFLRMGLKRLNNLPPEAPFWLHTNREPTLYKLGDYFGQRFRAGDQSDDVVWIRIADMLHYCADYGLGELLGILWERDFSAVEWVMAAGRWIRDISGFSFKSSLRDLLSRIRGDLPELHDRLDGLRQNASAHRLLMIDEAFNLRSKVWIDALTPP